MAVLRMKSRVTAGRSSCVSRWPCTRTMGREPDLRCRSEALRFTHSVSSWWKSMGLLLGHFLWLCYRRRAADRPQAEGGPHLHLEVRHELRVVLEVLLGVLAALADPLGLVRVPGPGLLHEVLLDRGVQDGAFPRDALAVDDVELRLAERRRELVLHHLDLGVHAHRLRAVLDRLLPPDVEADGRVELQRAAARRGFGAAKHDAYLFADLVDEDHRATRARDGRRELPERL